MPPSEHGRQLIKQLHEKKGLPVPSVTLVHLIALNQEISALVAAGVPLAQGLVRVADDFSGPTAAIARRIAERIEAGANLGDAIEAEGDTLPAAYRTLVQAGLKSGNLAVALEGYSETATHVAQLRRAVALASLYPVFLLIAAWLLFIFSCTVVLPAFDWLRIDDRFWAQPFRISPEWSWYLAPTVPVVLILGIVLWWRRSSRAAEASVGILASWLRWIPGIARVRRLSCQANFSELLGLFVDHRVPLDQALPLAADASGLSETSDSARELAAHLAAGHSLRTHETAFRQLPPLVRLALINFRGPVDLVNGLRRAAGSYRQRARTLADGIGFFLPIAMTTAIGGSVVFAYVVLLLQPYVATLWEVSQWQ